MATISSIGVGSGLPLDTLLDDLLKAESIPLQMIEQRQEAAQNRLSGYGVLKNALDGLFQQAEKVAQPKSLVALKARSSHDGLKVQANNQAIEGSYQIEVQQTARAQELISQGHDDLDAPLTDVDTTLNIRLNNGTHTQIEVQAGTSLAQLVERINAEPAAGIDATLVKDGSDSPYQLMLRARDTGTEAAVQQVQFDDIVLNDLLGFDADAAPQNYSVNAASDAEITVNGITITHPSNEFKDVIRGVDFSLSAHRSYDAPIEINISRDLDSSKKQITDLVDKYNQLLKDIDKLTRYDVESQTGSPLMGDSTTRRVKNQLMTALQFSLPDGAIRTLGQIGIETDHATGQLKINEDALSQALEQDTHGVSRLLAGENGLGAQLTQAIDPFLNDSKGQKGFIGIATDSIDNEIRGLQKQYAQTQDRIEARMANYQKQFQQLDLLVSQMDQTSTYLNQQLGMLANMNKQNG